MASLFEPDGARLVPTDLARGPWSRDALHGGPVAALVARAAEQCEPGEARHLARLTLELLRPVPLLPLDVTARVVRPGRKVQVVDVTVAAGGQDVAWGRAVRIRSLHTEDPVLNEPTPDATALPPPPEFGVATPSLEEGYVAFHNTGAELRFADGRFDRLGPCRVWVRLAVPVVPGEDPSPTQRAAAAADFGNGVSSIVDFMRYVFINPDLTVYLERPPVGEWVLLDASTRFGGAGIGAAESSLWDTTGRVGRSVQSLVVEPR